MTVRLRANGKSVEVRIVRTKQLQTIGIKNGIYSFTVESMAVAHRLHDAICSDLDRGIIPPEILECARAQKGGVLTVAEMYQTMRRDENYNESRSTTQILTTLYSQVAPIRMDSFTRADLLDWISKMKMSGNSPGTIRKKVGALRTIFAYALRSEKSELKLNVFDTLPHDYSQHNGYKERSNSNIKRDKIRDRRLNEGEEFAILEAIQTYKYDARRREINAELKASMQIMFHIAITTAMRLQEIFLLQWSHVDFDRNIINLPAGNTKAGKARQIPIATALQPILAEYRKQINRRDYVLPFYGYYENSRQKCSNALSRMWSAIFTQAGITDLNFHDLRHEGISRMVERTTLTLTQLQKISGHSDSRTFDRYNNLRTENITQNFY